MYVGEVCRLYVCTLPLVVEGNRVHDQLFTINVVGIRCRLQNPSDGECPRASWVSGWEGSQQPLFISPV